MGKIVVSTNVTLDGVVQDPDGKEGFTRGGWFGQFGGKDLEEWSRVSLDEELGAEALPGGQQRVLEGVLGVGEGPEHPVAVHPQLPQMRLGHRPERAAVPGPRP